MPDKNIQNILKDFLLLFYFIFKHKCKIQIDHFDISDSDSKFAHSGIDSKIIRFYTFLCELFTLQDLPKWYPVYQQQRKKQEI
jgi:hypothetical protein